MSKQVLVLPPCYPAVPETQTTFRGTEETVKAKAMAR